MWTVCAESIPHSFLLLEVYSLRLHPYKDLPGKQTNPSSLCTCNKRVLNFCDGEQAPSIRVSDTFHPIPAFLYVCLPFLQCLSCLHFHITQSGFQDQSMQDAAPPLFLFLPMCSLFLPSFPLSFVFFICDFPFVSVSLFSLYHLLSLFHFLLTLIRTSLHLVFTYRCSFCCLQGWHYYYPSIIDL